MRVLKILRNLSCEWDIVHLADGGDIDLQVYILVIALDIICIRIPPALH